MTTYLETLAASRRLALLRLLTEARGAANESVLQKGLEALGFTKLLRADVRSDLDWLKERALVTTDVVMDTVMVGKLTERGLGVAKGAIVVEGVDTPSIV